MRFGVIVFPGTWSDCDFHYVVSEVLHQPVRYVWHRERELRDLDCVILPGGFSYGDYLRARALAGRRGDSRLRRGRRARARLLQRVSDPERGGALAGRAHAQRMPAVPLSVESSGRRERRHAVHARPPARPGTDDADLAWGREILRRRREPRAAQAAEPRRLPLRGGRRPRL